MSDFIERRGHRRGTREDVPAPAHSATGAAGGAVARLPGRGRPFVGRAPLGSDRQPFHPAAGRQRSGTWDSSLSGASSDWSLSRVLETVVVAGRSSVRRCSATTGRVEVCNAKYGKNGWLGLASVWASNSHITQGTVKLNDTYFNTATYNTPAWRNSMMCQEIGHTLGLGHNDEDFGTTNGTCMDYSNDPGSQSTPGWARLRPAGSDLRPRRQHDDRRHRNGVVDSDGLRAPRSSRVGPCRPLRLRAPTGRLRP